MQLYKINDEIRSLMDLLENGVVSFEDENGETAYVFDKLNKLKLDRRKKLENIALLIGELEAGEEELANRSKLLAERSKRMGKRAEYLRNYIITSMELFEDKKIEGEIVELSLSKRDKVEIYDERKLPPDYFREKITYEPDKKKIAEAIANDEIVDGARVVKNPSLQIK